MPVVYLIPGGGSNYLSWFEQGMGNNIFDNLTAAGKLKPSILVSMQREDINGDSGRSTDFNMYEGDANSASVTDLDAWMDHYGITHNANGNGNYDVTAGNHNWPIWMKLMIVYASDYLWK